MENVIFVNKPKGISSFDVCFKMRKVLGTKKIGHTGTLDPNATGVMIILSNNATKANQFLVSDKKEYKTRVLYGLETDTLDIDGNIIKQSRYICPSAIDLNETLNSFLGKSKQEVPITSAVSVNGKRLYQYQLEGKEVKLPVRDIEVYSIHLDQTHDDGFTFTCEVSSGTYIRALVRDILKQLGVIGTVKELTRTKIDDIKIEDCDNLDDIVNGNFKRHSLYEVISKRYPVIMVDNYDDVKNGKRLNIITKYDRVAICSKGELLAIYDRDGDQFKCTRGLW